MDSSVGLAIQCVGIFLVTLLSFFVMRSIEGASQRYWTLAWAALSVSLSSLFIAFRYPSLQNFGYSLYFLGEYAFGYLFIAGCRYHSSKTRLTRKHLYALAGGVSMAVALPHLSDDFNDLFMVQAAIMSGLFAASFYALRHARRREQGSLGLRVMSIALVLLSLDFLHDVPVFSARKGAWGIPMLVGYLKYTSIFDLILEILLGFGTVMVLMEGVRREVEQTNRELTEARDKLELIARVDSLTEALNRHAFHSLLSKSRESLEANVSGCIAVIDLDDLKTINDTYGHAAGDAAIRAVAHAVRSLVRADDMLFRWGGDEFLLLMFGIPSSEARRRLETLNSMLARTKLPGTTLPVGLSVSHGLDHFTSLAQLDHSIEQADGAMYRRKQLHKKEQREAMQPIGK